jgi:hypothetical protein
MTELEDFCSEIARELGIELKTTCDDEWHLIEGENERVCISYQTDKQDSEKYTELLNIREKKAEASVGIANYVGYDHVKGINLQVKLPSICYDEYLAKLDEKSELAGIVKRSFEKFRNHDAGSLKWFCTYPRLESLDGVKELIYELLA